MFKQVHSGWPKAIRSIQNLINPGPTIYLSSQLDGFVQLSPTYNVFQTLPLNWAKWIVAYIHT